MLSSSISESVPQTLIRTGSDGRLRFSRQQRDALVDAFEASGVSAMAFAKEHGVDYQSKRSPKHRRYGFAGVCS
jgi:hypothetical protein